MNAVLTSWIFNLILDVWHETTDFLKKDCKMSKKQISWAEECEWDESEFQLEKARAESAHVREGVTYATVVKWTPPKIDSKFINESSKDATTSSS